MAKEGSRHDAEGQSFQGQGCVRANKALNECEGPRTRNAKAKDLEGL